MKVFVKDPDMYLNALDISLGCAVAQNEPAVVDASHRRFVNWEIFFFSDQERMARFEEDPLRYCGIVTDPVTKTRFRPHASSPRSDYRGRPYFFSSDSTLAVFRGMPETFADPLVEMTKEPSSGS